MSGEERHAAAERARDVPVFGAGDGGLRHGPSPMGRVAVAKAATGVHADERGCTARRGALRP